MTNRVAMLGVVAAAGIAVAGCGGDNVTGTATPGDPTTSVARTTSERAPTSPRRTTAPSGPAAGSDAVTAPGTRLKIGDAAVVPVKKGSASGLVSITVTAIEKGDQAAFEQKFGAKAQGLVPHYIKLAARNVGDADLSHTGVPRVSALRADGKPTGVSIVGELDDCQQERFPRDSGQGATVETCVLQAARPQDQVTGARYAESEGGYRDKPIVWSA